MSTEFQKKVSLALSASYNGDDCFDEMPSLRLATTVVTRNEQLSDMLRHHGHTYAFEEIQQVSHIFQPLLRRVVLANSDGGDLESEPDNYLSVRFEEDLSGLEDFTSCEHSIERKPRQGISAWLKEVYQNSRGFELGTFPSGLLPMSMKNQSENWRPIADGYMSDIIVIVHQFILDLLSVVCPDNRVRENLVSVLFEELSTKYWAAKKMMEFLLRVERNGNPLTLNHYFNDNLEKR